VPARYLRLSVMRLSVMRREQLAVLSVMRREQLAVPAAMSHWPLAVVAVSLPHLVLAASLFQRWQLAEAAPRDWVSYWGWPWHELEEMTSGHLARRWSYHWHQLERGCWHEKVASAIGSSWTPNHGA
jgi:hypothetical protein